ncbi:helix-turn-helix domain-containing protein [Thioalkalivibrio sp. ALJ15]|uniref:helix-turn-helix transcriptional regulator n=1 Tax=Thioalkalivibrio sp. ALJ15 TaxID=748652 RepID=UPI000A04FE33
MASDTYLTDRDLAARYRVHRTTPWRWVERGNFPAPVRLQRGVTRWRSSDVEAWEAARSQEGAA